VYGLGARSPQKAHLSVAVDYVRPYPAYNSNDVFMFARGVAAVQSAGNISFFQI